MNLSDLINSYEQNRNATYLTSYKTWIKKYLVYIYSLILISFICLCAKFQLGWITFIVGTVLFAVIAFLFIKIRYRHLVKKFNGQYGLVFTHKTSWTEYMTHTIIKAELKKILGNHVTNEPLMTRLKTQLQAEIIRNKRSLQFGIPVTGFITVLVASYVGFHLHYLESEFKQSGIDVLEKGKAFLSETGILIFVFLFIAITYKPIIELLLNQYSNRLEHLLTTLETIEIEYLSTKTESQIGA